LRTSYLPDVEVILISEPASAYQQTRKEETVAPKMQK